MRYWNYSLFEGIYIYNALSNHICCSVECWSFTAATAIQVNLLAFSEEFDLDHQVISRFIEKIVSPCDLVCL
jgi:hypothetical protein